MIQVQLSIKFLKNLDYINTMKKVIREAKCDRNKKKKIV